MSDSRASGPDYTWTCKCGIRLIAGDTVELDRLKGKHTDFHAKRREEA